MTANTQPASGNQFVPNAVIYRFPTSASGLIAIRMTE